MKYLNKKKKHVNILRSNFIEKLFHIWMPQFIQSGFKKNKHQINISSSTHVFISRKDSIKNSFWNYMPFKQCKTILASIFICSIRPSVLFIINNGSQGSIVRYKYVCGVLIVVIETHPDVCCRTNYLCAYQSCSNGNLVHFTNLLHIGTSYVFPFWTEKGLGPFTIFWLFV